jgi:hypothetical protein
VPLDREPRIVRPHTFPVVLDADLLLAAKLHVDDEAARTGVERILDELLDDRRGPFDDFAGGDLVGEVRRQERDLPQGLFTGGGHSGLKSTACGETA